MREDFLRTLQALKPGFTSLSTTADDIPEGFL
ncbi:hypothetical protein SFR_2651 [Streptomyces sp. FR-008]|nr:hypothetical protein SFR_2651 [Streptomyces sp. FR-008]